MGPRHLWQLSAPAVRSSCVAAAYSMILPECRVWMSRMQGLALSLPRNEGTQLKKVLGVAPHVGVRSMHDAIRLE